MGLAKMAVVVAKAAVKATKQLAQRQAHSCESPAQSAQDPKSSRTCHPAAHSQQELLSQLVKEPRFRPQKGDTVDLWATLRGRVRRPALWVEGLGSDLTHPALFF